MLLALITPKEASPAGPFVLAKFPVTFCRICF
jgi:hypothetical protein